MGGDNLAETCTALLSKQRYNPEILPQLEAFVAEQCAKNTYDLDCNLAVLKLYQFHPDTTNVSVVSKILLKAMMSLPSTDYITCTYLIPERVVRAFSPPPPCSPREIWPAQLGSRCAQQEMELIASIATLASLLEACSFRQFWKAVRRRRATSTTPTASRLTLLTPGGWSHFVTS